MTAPIVTGQIVKRLQAVDDGIGLLVLLKLVHPSWVAPVTIVNDTRDVEHAGLTYVSLPFAVTLPNDKVKEAPRARLEVDNVGRDITAQLELIGSNAVLMGTLILIARDTPETARWTFTAPVSGLQANVTTISGDMGWDQLMRRSVVRKRFDQFTVPGLFEEA